MGVHIHLREVSAYRRVKKYSFGRETAGTAVWCPLMGGVCLWKVSVSEGSTVCVTKLFKAEQTARAE